MAEIFRHGALSAGHLEGEIQDLSADLVERRPAFEDTARVNIHVPAHAAVGVGVGANLDDFKRQMSETSNLASAAARKVAQQFLEMNKGLASAAGATAFNNAGLAALRFAGKIALVVGAVKLMGDAVSAARDQLKQMVDIAAAFSIYRERLPAGRRVGIVTASGGAGGWIADACVAAGLEVPELDAETRSRVDAHIPSYGTSQNPVDCTAQAVRQLGYSKLANMVAASERIDSVVVVVSARSAEVYEREHITNS